MKSITCCWFVYTFFWLCSECCFAQKAITYPIGEFENVEKYSDQLCADDPYICDLLNRYAPKFIFHPNEKFLPSTVNYYLDHSSLRYRYSKKKTKEILPVGEVSGSNLGTQVHGSEGNLTVAEISKHQPSFRKSRTRGEYYVEVADQYRNEIFNGFGLDQMDEQLLVYGNYGKLFKDERFMGYQLQYWLFFPNNGSIGYHEGDWEGISVTVDSTGAFVYATYMSHGRSGTYLPEQIIFADSAGNEQVTAAAYPDQRFSHPLVFVSKAMHASFPNEKVRRRWKLFIPLPADRTKRGPSFNSFGRVQLLPNRFMATKKMKWVQFTGRWGGRRSNLFNSPEGATAKRGYYRGTWFRHKDVKKDNDLRARGNRIGSIWGRLRFEPRLPIGDSENRWVMMLSRSDIRLQSYAELYRRDDPIQKYHNLNLYNFNNVITGIISYTHQEDTYITFEDINFGGKMEEMKWSGNNPQQIEKVNNNDRISSICWEKCEESSWVSFFKNRDFKGESYFLNGELNASVANFNETELGGNNVTSVRYCLPEGYKLILYDQPDFAVGEYMIELPGNGSFTQIDFHFDDIQMDDVIQSARIIRD